MTELTYDEARELLGAYALDAVDGDERAEVERWLATNPELRAEVEQHREVAQRAPLGVEAMRIVPKTQEDLLHDFFGERRIVQ